jgi:hypothetical protein
MKSSADSIVPGQVLRGLVHILETQLIPQRGFPAN